MLLKSISFILGTLFCLASLQSAAESQSTDSEALYISKPICEMQAEDFLDKARYSDNLTNPGNNDGPFGIGVCWWHSKLQRAAIYLTVFDRPNDPRPTSEEAKKIFKDLTRLNKVISIPGFSNWYQFTDIFRREFFETVGDWQINQTLQFEFVKGIRALKATDDYQLQKISREVNDYKRVTFVLLKRSGFEAHSWLVTAYSGTVKGFEMSFLDSNFSTASQSYKSQDNTYVIREAYANRLAQQPNGSYAPATTTGFGYTRRDFTHPNAKGLAYPTGASMSLYLQNDNSDFMKITDAIRKHCGGETAFTLHEKEVRAKKEQRAFDQINWWRPGVPHN